MYRNGPLSVGPLFEFSFFPGGNFFLVLGEWVVWLWGGGGSARAPPLPPVDKHTSLGPGPQLLPPSLCSWALISEAAAQSLPMCDLSALRPTAEAAGHGRDGVCGSQGPVCVRVQWQQCNGMWGVLSDVQCQSWRAADGCADQPVFHFPRPTGMEAVYRLWRVHPEIQDVGCPVAGAGGMGRRGCGGDVGPKGLGRRAAGTLSPPPPLSLAAVRCAAGFTGRDVCAGGGGVTCR